MTLITFSRAQLMKEPVAREEGVDAPTVSQTCQECRAREDKNGNVRFKYEKQRTPNRDKNAWSSVFSLRI